VAGAEAEAAADASARADVVAGAGAEAGARALARVAGDDRGDDGRGAPPRRAWPLAELVVEGAAIDLRVGPGEIVCVQGPTGAGKTTLLRTLLGLEQAAVGATIGYGGEAVERAGVGPGARPFAWVPQDAPLLSATLDANVTLGARAFERGRGSWRAAREVLAELGAGAARLAGEVGEARLGADRRRLSGGERQWVALARAIATEQPVLLLDEPTAGLDAASQRQVLDALARLRGKRSVVIVTHRPEPLEIADRVVRFEDRLPPLQAAG
jgi:ABC-type transport system involved in cytochrome bd biosynthesis fused ATPase/permease subunit